MSLKYFYDIHCHAMNLSHPNFLSIIKRLKLSKYLFLNSIPIVNNIVSIFTATHLKRILNLLSVMDRDMCDFLLTIEEKDFKPFLQNNKIDIGGKIYDKVILTPLMMDFGTKDFSDLKFKVDIWYKDSSHKPIAEQVIDLFDGIKKYKKRSELQIFEIYPFLGLNTINYDMESKDGHTGLIDLLDKYFGDYSKKELGERHSKLKDNMGNFSGNLDKLGCFSFSGIKVYPPLGFDPFPDDEKEREKVDYLYNFCQSKAIPITAHCSEGGYNVLPKKLAREYASPEKWEKVLEKYPELRLNLAHLGGKLEITKWLKLIVDMIFKYKYVYTDFSCKCFKDRDYRKLKKIIDTLGENRRAKLLDKILFGSDFMINLLNIDSYFAYLDFFNKTDFITKIEKEKFCNKNPARFLFG